MVAVGFPGPPVVSFHFCLVAGSELNSRRKGALIVAWMLGNHVSVLVMPPWPADSITPSPVPFYRYPYTHPPHNPLYTPFPRPYALYNTTPVPYPPVSPTPHPHQTVNLQPLNLNRTGLHPGWPSSNLHPQLFSENSTASLGPNPPDSMSKALSNR